MLFIRNLTDEANSDFAVCMTKTDETVGLRLFLPNEEEITILTSSVPDIDQSIKRSIEHIGKNTDTLCETASGLSCSLAEKPTEVAFYVKGERIGIVADDETLPVNVEVIPEKTSDEKQRRYPRDMVLFICERDAENDVVLNVDNRNLVGKPIVASTEKYQFVLAMIKWPIWNNLRFPVYMYMTQGEKEFGATQLGSRTENKITKNQLDIDVEVSEAKSYLEESARIMAERAEQAKRHNNENGGGYHKNKGDNVKGSGRDGGYNKGNRDGKFSSKHPKGNNGAFGGKGKNFRRNGQR